MGLYKITCKKTSSYSGGQKLEKGMSVEIIDNNNPLTTANGKEKVREAIKAKYGTDILQFASSSYFESEKLN
jgi:hypothetical protein